MSEFRLIRLQRNDALVDKFGLPTLFFQRGWQGVVTEIEAQGADIATAQTDITALEDALALYVLQDQTAAWADPTGTLTRTTFAAYAGQTVSNPPTQAQVQAIDDHVKVLSERLAALVTDLRANGVLT